MYNAQRTVRSVIQSATKAVIEFIGGIIVGNFNVLDSDGNSFEVTTTVLNSSGTSFNVSHTVLNSGGTGFSVI